MAFFFLEVASSFSGRSPFSSEATSGSPRSPMSPFSAVAPSRLLCTPRPLVLLTLDTIAEEDSGDAADGSPPPPSPRFLPHK